VLCVPAAATEHTSLSSRHHIKTKFAQRQSPGWSTVETMSYDCGEQEGNDVCCTAKAIAWGAAINGLTGDSVLDLGADADVLAGRAGVAGVLHRAQRTPGED